MSTIKKQEKKVLKFIYDIIESEKLKDKLDIDDIVTESNFNIGRERILTILKSLIKKKLIYCTPKYFNEVEITIANISPSIKGIRLIVKDIKIKSFFLNLLEKALIPLIISSIVTFLGIVINNSID